MEYRARAEALVAAYCRGHTSEHARTFNDHRRSRVRKLVMDATEDWDRDGLLHEADNHGHGHRFSSYKGTFSTLRDTMDNSMMVAVVLGLADEEIIRKLLRGHKPLSAPYAAISSLVTHMNQLNLIIWREALLIGTRAHPNDTSEDLKKRSERVARVIANAKWDSGIDTEDFQEFVINHAMTMATALAEGGLDPKSVHDMDTTTTTEKDTTMTDTNIDSITSGLEAIGDGERAVVDALLQKFNVPQIDDIESKFQTLREKAKEAASGPTGVKIEVKLEDAYGTNKVGDLPDGKVDYRKASDVFGITGKGVSMFDFDVPVWTWDAEHPMVPEVDDHYRFEPSSLLRALMAVVMNKMAWIYGHTGTGKSTLVEQICARLKFPMIRVNFDSEITRMDLTGRDTLTIDASTGTQITEFVEGLLPQALQMPCVMLADELDAIRPDVAYVYQRVLEGNGMVLNENGGQVIKPHPWFRLMATGNSRGNGDTSGMYNAVRPQSMAMLDRFGVWIEVDYMAIHELKRLLKSKFSALNNDEIDLISKYANEHWTAFKGGDLRQPLSPRGVQAVAEQYTFFKGLMAQDKAIEQAIRCAVADRAEESDAQVIAGLMQRVKKS